MSVDHVGWGPWWTSHHGWYRAPPQLGHGSFQELGTCRDRGGKEEDDVVVPFCFLPTTGRQQGGCSTEKFNDGDWSSSEQRMK
jgi:hypothetical protein